MNTQDIYWLAGLLEGEGSFSRLQLGRSKGITLALRMTDLDVVTRAAGLVGHPSVNRDAARSYPSSYPGRKAIFSWRIRGARAAGVLMTIYSLMGSRRKQQIRDMLSYWQSRPKPRQKFRKCLGRCT